MASKMIIIILFLSVSLALADDCKNCDRSKCPILTYCTFGVIQDSCGCCEVCANDIGDKCDFQRKKSDVKVTFVHGNCGEYLQCVQSDGNEGKCVCDESEAVCGSDGITYETICDLLKATANDKELTLYERIPCRTGPKIKNGPQDAVRPLGSILILDCEATGFPVPTITWELHKDDGSTVTLPSDDSLVAVQVRGGPEKHMVTGWIQIIQILPENVGFYTCIATNLKGEVRASARVSFKKTRN